MKTYNFCLLILLVVGARQQCSSQTALTGVETGTLTAGVQPSNFVLTGSSAQTDYIYQLIRVQTASPQVAFALNSFDGKKGSGFAFQILVTQSSITALSVRLITPAGITQWASLKFSLLVSSRNDFQVGIYNVLNWSPTQNQIVVPFAKTYNDTSNLVARPFLAGIQIQTNSTGLSLQMLQMATNQTSFTVGVAASSPITSISISYFVFSPPNAGFASYGGVASQPQIQGPLYQILQSSLSTLSNYMYGVTGFSTSDMSGQFSLSTNLDSRFILTMAGKLSAVSVSFIVFGNSPSAVCASCPGTIPNYNSCVTACTNSQALFSFADGSKACIECPSYAFLQLNPSRTDCICQTGYYIVRGVCMPILTASSSQSASLANLSSEALQAQFFNTLNEFNTTTTTTSSVPNYQNNQVLRCSDPNSYLSGSSCFCSPGFYNIAGICRQCPEGTFYNQTQCSPLQLSTPTPGPPQRQMQPQIQNSIGQSTQTTSTLGTNLPPGALPIGNYPQTNSSGYSGLSQIPAQSNGMLPVFTPGPLNPFPQNISNNTVNIGNPNVPMTIVPGGIDPSYYYPPGLVPQNLVILINITLGSGTNQVVCPWNQYSDSRGVCLCIPGYIKGPNGLCSQNIPDTSCNMKYGYITAQGYCVCQIGYAFNLQFLCVPIGQEINCPLGGVIQPDRTCICPLPFLNSNGICVICKDQSYWNGSVCVVTCNLNTVFDPSLNRCACPNGFYLDSSNTCTACPGQSITISNICVFCPPNSQRIGNKCQCLPGTALTNGICSLICPYQSYFNQPTSKCICIKPNQYVDATNTCVNCPTGQVLFNGKCIPCAPPSWLDPVAGACFVCAFPGFISQGVCIQCPSNAQWNLQTQTCICVNGYQVTNGICISYVNCPSGVFIGGLCVVCPNGQVINSQCQCNQGFVLANGVCVQVCPAPGVITTAGICVVCPANSVWNSATQRCICLPLYSPDSYGRCTKICPPGSSLQMDNNCYCNNGYFAIGDPQGNCALCPSLCTACSSYTSCFACISGYTLVNQQCVISIPPVVCPTNLFPCANNPNNCCVCQVPNCLSCLASSSNICVICSPGYQAVNGQCVPNNINQGCIPACQAGFYCLNNICVTPANNAFLITLISSISSGIADSRFTISISPTVTYYQTLFAGNTLLMQAASKAFVKISFSGLVVTQNLQSYCIQDFTNLSRWNCIVSYQNQPPAVSYTLIMTAVNPQNTNQAGYLLLKINPVQASTSIGDSTVAINSIADLGGFSTLTLTNGTSLTTNQNATQSTVLKTNAGMGPAGIIPVIRI